MLRFFVLDRPQMSEARPECVRAPVFRRLLAIQSESSSHSLGVLVVGGLPARPRQSVGQPMVDVDAASRQPYVLSMISYFSLPTPSP